MSKEDIIKKEEEMEEEDSSEEDEDFEVKQEDGSSSEEEEEEESDESEEEFDINAAKNAKRSEKQDISKHEKQVKKKVKKEDDDDEDGEGEEGGDLIKWKYLEHHGVLFPDYWKRHNVRIRYDGEAIDNLTIYQEEMATYWAQTLGTEYETERKIYKDNFKRQWMKTWKGNKEYTDFEKFNFQSIKDYLEDERQKRKDRTKEEKLEQKKLQEQKDKAYGYAIIDGELERIGGYMIEPPTLFKGRGEHPKAGIMKARIIPEQLTINVALEAPVPKCLTPGHNWLEVVHKQDVTWLGGYKDDTINKTHKYIQMAATSKFKYQNDMKKYERARRLKKIVDQVRNDYKMKMSKGREKDKQLGTAAYLIDFLALRVGNEKGEDEADTVGCCSLRVEHVSFPEEGKITFDFLGKDSMRYHNTVEVDTQAWENLKSFTKGKKGPSDLFDRIQASDMNEYLKNFMEDLSAKVFRTYNASNTLQKELDKSVDKGVLKMTTEQKAEFYDNAVKQVAILCNHQKTVGKSFDLQIEKLKYKIEVYEKYLEELEAHHKKFKGSKGPKKDEREVILEKKDDGNHKMYIKKYPESKDKTATEITKLKEKIRKEKQNVEKRESNKDIALGTSKTNYNDPRVTVAWCKAVDQPIEKPFPKTLRDKFLWAMSIEPEWKF